MRTTHWPGALHDTAFDEPDCWGSAGNGAQVVPPLHTQLRLASPEPKFEVVRMHQVAVGHDRPVTPRMFTFDTVARVCQEVPFQ